MFRRSLSILLVLVIAASGFQPALGMAAANAPAMEMSAEADCPEMQKGDCCDQTEKGKRLCIWTDACATRCHVNAALEVGPYVPMVCSGALAALASREPSTVKSARAGPLFRPPIV